MSLLPEGYLSVPKVALQKTIAASARFQAVAGVASASAAEARVHLQLSDDEEQEGTDLDNKRLKHPRPRAIVFSTEGWQRERRGPGEWNFECVVAAAFEFKIPEEYSANRNDQCIWFENQIGVILREMEVLRDSDTTGDYLPFHRIGMITDPMPCYEPTNIEPFWGCEVAFSYL